MADLEGGARHARRQEKVVAFEEAREHPVHIRALELRANIVADRRREPPRGGGDEARLGLRLHPLAIGRQQRREG